MLYLSPGHPLLVSASPRQQLNKYLLVFLFCFLVLGAALPNMANAASPRFAFVTNQSSDALSIFMVDSATGQLIYRGVVATGTAPQSVTVDPAGRFVYVTNRGSNDISVYAITPLNGEPITDTVTAVGTPVAAGAPVIRGDYGRA